jgi:hypothetical protein
MGAAFPLPVSAGHLRAYEIPERRRIVDVSTERMPRNTWVLDPKSRKASGCKSSSAKPRIRVRVFDPRTTAPPAHAVHDGEDVLAVPKRNPVSPTITFPRRRILPWRIGFRGRTPTPGPPESALGERVQPAPPQV